MRAAPLLPLVLGLVALTACDATESSPDLAPVAGASSGGDASRTPDADAPAAEPGAEPGPAPAAEPVAEPVAEPAAEPVGEPVGEPAEPDAARARPKLGADLCTAPPAGVSSGYGVGQQLAALTLKDCDGQPVAFSDLCGAAATWGFFAHGWCPHCKLAASFAESVAQTYGPSGGLVVNVLVQSSAYATPTAQDCQAWRAQYGHDAVLTLYDDSAASTALWDNSYTALSVFMNQDQVVIKKLHSDVQATIDLEMKVLLGLF